ncbi:MAG: hypothetical protein JRE58_05815 [Deltaproteobacteria bacterium]|nr:hypothetical protein [Deltaproteobacteria bacterium]
MNEDHKSDFRIRIDEDEPSRSFFHPEVENQQINKLRKRITFMSFFTLCLLAIALTFAYIDIKKQVGGFHVSGSRGFETISQDVESRFSSLSVKYAEIEDKFSNKITALENSVASVKTDLDKTAASQHKSAASIKKSLQTIQSSKADKKALSSLKKKTAATLVALQKDMEKFPSMLQNMDSEYDGVLAEFQQDLKSIGKKILDLQSSLSDLAAVSARRPTKEKIKADLHDQELVFQNQVDELTTLLNRNDDKIEILISRIEALKKDFNEIAGTTPAQPAPPTPKPTEPSKNTVPDDSTISNDGVDEQNIQ